MNDPLQFTGERFTPECVREIWYEHWHRYALATRFAAGRRVLDAACGEGYGSALLAAHAREVVGVEISDEALAHARGRYAAPNLRFERGDATALAAFPDASFDLIVSFETLEHVQEQEALVAGFARLLAPGGLLLLSSPDKRTYSEVAGFANEFHVRELYREELDALRVMGINPIRSLVVPRVLAATTVALALSATVILVGLTGAFLFCVTVQHVSAGAFVGGLDLLTGPGDIIVALIKATLFGMAAGLIACYKGTSVRGGPAGVGNAVNETVVFTFMVLFAINIVVTAVGIQFTLN